MKRLRHIYRAFIARFFPMRFAEFVNADRCSLSIINNPSGEWSVQIGVKHPAQTSLCLGRAMVRAFLIAEADPEWHWLSDSFRRP